MIGVLQLGLRLNVVVMGVRELPAVFGRDGCGLVGVVSGYMLTLGLGVKAEVILKMTVL